MKSERNDTVPTKAGSGKSHLILKKDFHTQKTNQKWVTDVTEFTIKNQKVDLSTILDLYNGEIISYNISLYSFLVQITDMLDKAFCKIPDHTKPILHSNQSWQYQMEYYQKKLEEKGIVQSMS